MQVHTWMLTEPRVLLGHMRIEIIHNHMQLAVRILRLDFVHERQKILAPAALKMP